MRLINTKTFELREFLDIDIPSYAILSHRWEEDEILYNTVLSDVEQGLQGDTKIRRFCSQVSCRYELEWAWVDTCCIDKSSSAELSEAINSMYRWYQDAAVCMAYLSDVDDTDNFKDSQWFTRGWTLQELLAPMVVEFYNRHWQLLGTRDELASMITDVSGIAQRMLNTGPHHSPIGRMGELLRRSTLRSACIAQKMSWASNRTTSRIEDMAYCLLGLFDVNMPLLYGEGDKAFNRLQQEILRVSDDESIFAWSRHHPQGTIEKRVAMGALAPSPDAFRTEHAVRRLGPSDQGGRTLAFRKPYSITNKGLLIEVHLLQLGITDAETPYFGIPLQCTDGPKTRSCFPLVLRVVQATGDVTGKSYQCDDGLVSLNRATWGELLPGEAGETFDQRLSARLMQEIHLDLSLAMATWLTGIELPKYWRKR